MTAFFANNFKEDFKKEVKWVGPQGHALETRIRSFRPVRNDSSACKYKNWGRIVDSYTFLILIIAPLKTDIKGILTDICGH